MVTKRLATQVAAGPSNRASAQIRTAKVVDLLEPSTDEVDVVTGWQVQIEFDGGEVRRAGVAASYRPVAGDTVAVTRQGNSLFVVDRITAGDTGELPGGRVAYSYVPVTVAGNYTTAGAGTEQALAGLTVSALLRTGAAYQVELFTGCNTSVANSLVAFQVRNNSTAGVQITEFFRVATTIAANVMYFRGVREIRNDTGVDQTLVLVPTIVAPAGGTANAYGNPLNKPWFEVRLLGASKLFPHASAIPVPADFTA